MTSLHTKAWLSLAILAVVTGLLLFVPAGTVRYWHAWVYLAIFLGVGVLTTRDLMKHDPALLERRLHGGPTAERRPVQKLIMLGTSLCFIALLVVPALDFRFAWSRVPAAVVVLGEVLNVVGFYFIFLVYRANSYASASVEIAADQSVISTGPYAIVRHPMYASATLYLIGTPLALGSYWGLLAFAAMMPLLVWRLLDEERLLTAELPGYREYQQRVRYRLVPWMW